MTTNLTNSTNKVPNVPPLRFPEFTGEWEKKQLNHYAQKITQKNKDNSVSNVLSNSATLGLIPQSDFFDRDIANKENTDGYYVIANNDFVYNPRKSATAPFGPINIYEGNELGIISPLYLCFRAKGIQHKFLYYFFKSPAWYRYMYINGDSGARHDRVSIPDDFFFNLPLHVPNEKEQYKVAHFLDLLDTRIETQNKIIEDLKTLKSAISAKLLHNSCWNDMKIHEICHTLNYKQYIAKNIQETGEFPVIQQGDNPICGYSHETPFDNYKNVLLFGDHTLSLYKPNSKFLLATDGIKVLLPTGHIKRDFLYYLLEANMPKSEGYKRHYSILKEVNVKVPPIEEQEKISGVFIAIDDKIALEQLLKSSYKTQKAFLLQQMFI